MDAAKLSLSPLKGHDQHTEKHQRVGSVEVWINNDRAHPCNISETGREACYRSENNYQAAEEETWR